MGRVGSWAGAFVVAAGVGWACTSTPSSGISGDCTIGAEGCECTPGGACDTPLTCVDGKCVSVPGTGGPDDEGDDTTGSATAGGTVDGTTAGGTTGSVVDDGTTTTGDGTTGDETDDPDDGPILDVSMPDLRVPVQGCQAIDMLFAIDGSASMAEERAALAATGAFTDVINTLEGLNEGNIDYRIGVTDDDDHGFLVPPGWSGGDPWFDSESMSAMEIATAFNGAVGQVGGIGGAPTGCEHVLTSATDLVDGDTSGFVREDALLVLVLLSDVDDYGAYDQSGGNTCGIGCATPPPVLDDLYDTLVAIKGGDAAGLAAIVVAGDPSSNAGFNFCDQPGSCGCVEVFPGLYDCDIFHATRLYDFADLLGSNGYAADLCDGSNSVPTSVETALTESIDIACQNYEPEG